MIRLLYGLIFVLLVAESGMSFILALQIYFVKEATNESRRLAAVFFGISIQSLTLMAVSLLQTLEASLTFAFTLGVGILILVIPLVSMTLDSIGLLDRWTSFWDALWHKGGGKGKV